MYEVGLGSSRSGRCDGGSRRDAPAGGGPGALGLPLPGLLRAEAARGPNVRAGARAKSVILVYLGGGLSHHDSFDLKPQAPPEVRGKYKPIPSSVPGLQV